MKKSSRFLDSLKLYLIFLKLGTFSIGGGTTMLTLLRDDLVVRRRYIDDEELMEMTAISESTPGPIAVNLATYLGYKKAGVLGSLMATLGTITTPFVLMFIISLFLRNLLEYEIVQYAFLGIKAGVVFLILRVGFTLIKGMKKDWLAIAIFSVVMILELILYLFNIDFYAFYYILAGLLIGFLYYGFIQGRHLKNKEEEEKK